MRILAYSYSTELVKKTRMIRYQRQILPDVQGLPNVYMILF